ncbi:uncharacterized protein CTRU02_208616 [Colletotrichum truncatum]|uniref:Uncharacterized protein n=1 Tax=Colletotrichum truncatum TaxID=5467 RepID=A0ACC3YWY5_COLTU|nr:uncharacterized protein CTRU02_15014 [Colletotrichum truncatum]KAF6781509.1 hypothetical protein CTRU02_15014 [Colletotrichum truncatum]
MRFLMNICMLCPDGFWHRNILVSPFPLLSVEMDKNPGKIQFFG